MLALAGLHRVLLERAEAREAAAWEVRLVATARDRQAAIERWVQDLKANAATMAAYPTAVWLLEARPSGPPPFPTRQGARAHLGELLGRALQAHGYRAAWVLAADGRLVAASDGGPAPAAAAELGRLAARDGRAQVRLLRTPAEGAVLAAAPVVAGRGQVLGAVVLEEDPAHFLYPLLSYQPGPTQSGEVLLSERAGGDVFILSPLRKSTQPLRLRAASGTPATAAAAGERRFLTDVHDYAGDPVWAATQPIRGTAWGLQAKVDRTEALAPARREALLEVLALGGLLAALFGLAFGLWRQLRARREAAVAHERARFSTLLRHAADPIVIMDAAGVIRDVNERTLDFYQRPRGWLIGRSAGELRAPEVRGGFPERLQQSTAAGRQVYETVHQDAAGQRLPVEISSRLVDIDGERLLLAIIRDLRERQAAALRLRESEERYRAIVENSPDVICRLDRDARFLYVSPSAARAWSAAAAALVGQGPEQLGYTEAQAAAVAHALEQVFAEGAARELKLDLAEGRNVRHFLWRIFPEYDADGRIGAAVALVQDVTEARRLEEQFQHAQKMEAVGRLAGGVAHDFNNILTAIHGHAALARAELPDDAALAAELEEIMTAADRAASLTRQLLAFSRRQILQPRRVDLAATVRAMEPMLRRLIGEQVEVVYELPAGPVHILADPGQIEQILLNLVVNARDAMDDGGRLTVSLGSARLGRAERTGRFAALRVADTGCGMTGDVRERIFEPFFTTKEQGRGTGLGLSTVYGIVQQSGGDIDVESTPGRGTTFTVYLPCAEDDAPERGVPAAPSPAAQHGRVVLLAEDDATVRRLTERLLRSRGYQVLCASDGEEALRVAAAHPDIDLLLTDVVMPNLGGIELARRLRAERPDLAVVFMTGYTHDFTDQAALIDPALHIVHKPFDGNALLGRLEVALRTTSPTR